MILLSAVSGSHAALGGVVQVILLFVLAIIIIIVVEIIRILQRTHGKQKEKRCSKCGQLVKTNSNFCMSCGAKVK